jgi:PAS domain S-box-containing protein
MRRRPNRDRKLSKTRGRNAETLKRRDASNSRRGRSAGSASETELAGYIRERDEAQEQQAATAEVLKVISRSTFDLQTVLDTLTKSAVQLCAADRGVIFMQDGDLYRARAVFGFSREAEQYALENPLRRDRGSATGRVALEGKAVHIPDLLADPEYTATGLKAFDYRTILSVPLQRDGTTIGIFSLTRDKVNPFTDEQIELVRTFADRAVIAIENTRLLNELRESLKQQTATADVLRVISSSPGDLEPVFSAMLENAIRICDATFGNIYRYDGEGLHLVAWHNTPAALVEDRKCSPYRPSSTTPTGRALASKATVHVLDAVVEPAYAEERDPGMVAVVELGGMRTYVVVPLLKEAEVIGVLTVLRQEVRAFTDKQIELLQNFAAQAVIAIENARLLNELRQLLEHHRRAEASLADSERQLRKAHDELEMNLVEAMKRQTATSEVMRIISSSPIQSVLDAVAENAARLCEANNAEIFRLENNLLRLVASYGEIPVNIHAREGIPANRDRVIGRATCDRRTIQVDNLATEDGEFPAGSEDAKREGHRTTLATPLLREGVPIGVILIRRWEIRPFYAKQIALLENFADQAVIAIENARLFEAEKQRSLALVQANRDLAEREAKIRRLVDELRRSEAYLAEAQRLSHTGSFGWKPDSGEIVWSDETYRIFEYDPAVKPTIDSVVQRVHPHDKALVQQVLDRASQTGTDFEHEYRLLLADGRVKHVHAIAYALQDASGNREFIGAVSDVTERKTTEDQLRWSAQELQRSEFYLAEGQRLGRAGSWALNPSGFFEYWSRELFQIYGLDPQKRAPTLEEYLATVHPQDRDFMAETIKRMCEQGSGCDAKKRIIRPDGAVRYIRCVGIPVLDNGVLKRFLGTAMDVTEQEQLTQELQRREAYLAEAQRLSQTGSWAWSPDQDIRYWSEECYRVLSFDPQDGLPRFEEFVERIHPDDQPGFRELIQTAIREKAEWEADYRIVHLDGPVRDIHVVGHPVLSTSGQLVEFVGTVIDVTERRRAEQERARLRQLEADLAHINRVSTLGEMATSLAHEITQPIASARNNARAALNFLDRQPPDLGEVKEALECVVADADRGGDIVDRIRDHIKKAPPRKNLFDLNEAINEVIVLARSAITKNGVTVQTRLTEGPLLLRGDRVQLQQVVLNLILNAVEAMGSVEAGPRELLIRTEQHQPNGVLVAVRDSGPGIDPEHVERVFEAFYTTKSNGVGMGLSICQSIIEAHGGRLWADANEPRGAVFQFTLPSAEKLMNSLQAARQNAEPRADTVLDARH